MLLKPGSIQGGAAMLWHKLQGFYVWGSQVLHAQPVVSARCQLLATAELSKGNTRWAAQKAVPEPMLWHLWYGWFGLLTALHSHL
jgi:hypothetical protein